MRGSVERPERAAFFFSCEGRLFSSVASRSQSVQRKSLSPVSIPLTAPRARRTPPAGIIARSFRGFAQRHWFAGGIGTCSYASTSSCRPASAPRAAADFRAGRRGCTGSTSSKRSAGFLEVLEGQFENHGLSDAATLHHQVLCYQ